jgi:hypothetical protein
MPLSDTAIRQAKPAVRPIKMFDGRGLWGAAMAPAQKRRSA